MNATFCYSIAWRELVKEKIKKILAKKMLTRMREIFYCV